MSDRIESSDSRMRLVFAPALITLAITFLRLTGELRHWSERWFSPETGGIRPQGVSWLFGITWLPAIFGVYFALRLVRDGRGPRSLLRPAVFAALGVALFLVFNPIVAAIHTRLKVDFPAILIPLWAFWLAAGLIQYFGWPELFRTLLLYAYAARIPVAIVMFFAMLGSWGTHYDYVGTPLLPAMSLVPRYLWLAFFPQLLAWVGFTIALGAVTGVVAAALARLSRSPVRQGVDRVDLGS